MYKVHTHTHKYTCEQIHIRTNTHTHKYTYTQIHIPTNTHTPKEADPSHLHTKDHFASNFSAKHVLSFPVNILPHAPLRQHNKQAMTKKVTPAQCLPNIVQMVVSGAASVVKFRGSQLGILLGKVLGMLLVECSSWSGIQLGGWQWQRILSIAAMAGT